MRSFLIGIAALSMATIGAAQTFTVFTVNGNPTGAAAINSSGTVTGNYDDTQSHGYVRSYDGTISTFDPTGSSFTYPTAINGHGQVTGYFTDKANGNTYGFIRGASGTIITFAPKGITKTYPYAINNNGNVVGACQCAGGGFIRYHNGEIYLVSVNGLTGTPTAINAYNTIAGTAVDGFEDEYGFFGTLKGGFTAFQDGTLQTTVAGINTSGVITGSVGASGSAPSGYVRDTSGNFSVFSLGYSLTPAGINDAGTVAGTYYDFSQYSHGFYRTTDGTLTPFDAPTLGLPYTMVSGINKNGYIVGVSDEGAFIYVP